MPERPLVLFGTPILAEKARRHGGASRYNYPTFDRQVARISPKFQVLQDVVDVGNLTFTNRADGIEPEYTVVFETVGDPSGFDRAIKKLKTQHPEIEWLMELSDECSADEDFFAINDHGVREDGKAIGIKLFGIMTNLQALRQMLSLWDHFKTDENYQFPNGLTGFKHLFKTLKDVRLWGVQERIEETGLLDAWSDDLQDPTCVNVRAQVELFHRSSDGRRTEVEETITQIVTATGGRVLSRSSIPEICYHALLVELPRAYAERVINHEHVELVIANDIMFVKPATQSIGVTDFEITNSEETVFASPDHVFDEPLIALFDGMPQENHPLLSGLLTVDDPDELSQGYQVQDRLHGTSMASLIARGIDVMSIKSSVRKIYVRPIMKAKRLWNGSLDEYIPDEYLLVDKIHEAVRRLFEPASGSVAPSIRVINLSIGLAYREYYNLISPLARLLDWLSYKYRVLFVVSAGNHVDDISLGMAFNEFAALGETEKNARAIKHISDNIRNHRVLSPAESMNSLTVGALFDDNRAATPMYNLTSLCSNGLPAVYSSFGSGINNSIKPDLLYYGGTKFIKENIVQRNTGVWANSTTRAPGILSAMPGNIQQGNLSVGYSIGTSNSAALISHEASLCYECLNEVFESETGFGIPREYAAVLLKAMLAHGASWNGMGELFRSVLMLNGQVKGKLHKFLGYGVPDISKVKECTKNRVTLVGYGDIKQGDGYLYEIPIPFDFHTQKYRRKLTVTLAYFSPVRPTTLKYREKQVWFTLDAGSNVAGPRLEFDYNAVTRGTLQHEVFETEDITVWDENSSLVIKVNCRDDASKTPADTMIPYALFATFEMAPEYDVDVYQEVVSRVRIRDAITAAGIDT